MHLDGLTAQSEDKSGLVKPSKKKHADGRVLLMSSPEAEESRIGNPGGG